MSTILRILEVSQEKGWIDLIATEANKDILKFILSTVVLHKESTDSQHENKIENEELNEELNSLLFEAEKQLLLMLINAKIPIKELEEFLKVEEEQVEEIVEI